MELPDRDERDDDAAALIALLLFLEGSEADIGPGSEMPPEEFWERSRDRTRETIVSLLALAFLASAELHGASDRDAAWQESRRWARQHADWFSGVTTDATRRMLQSVLDGWRAVLSEGGSVSADEQERALERIWGLQRAVVWASDLITAAQTRGGEWAVGTYGRLSDEDLWETAADELTCSVCFPLHLQPRRVWGVEFPEGPPVHPRCRCVIRHRFPPEEAA